MMRHNVVEEAVLEQWGLRVITEQDCPPEDALETFLGKLSNAVQEKQAEDALRLASSLPCANVGRSWGAKKTHGSSPTRLSFATS